MEVSTHRPRPQVGIVISLAPDVFQPSFSCGSDMVRFGGTESGYTGSGYGGVGIQEPDAQTFSSRYHDRNVTQREETIEITHSYWKHVGTHEIE